MRIIWHWSFEYFSFLHSFFRRDNETAFFHTLGWISAVKIIWQWTLEYVFLLQSFFRGDGTAFLRHRCLCWGEIWVMHFGSSFLHGRIEHSCTFRIALRNSRLIPQRFGIFPQKNNSSRWSSDVLAT